MALGATAGCVISAIVRRGLALAVIGILLGVAGAFALTRFLDALVFGIKPADPLTFSAGAVCLLVLAAVASALPALRIARMDPAKALRVE
jgi:ABC-type antimicrobial peptide transport system permease subunit